MIIWQWFKCPYGHSSLISEEDAERGYGVLCDICLHYCFVSMGTLGEKVVDKDYMSALKG